MQLQAGTILKSTDGQNDTMFHDAIILITELNQKGAVGFIVNKPANRKLNELLEFRESPPFPINVGGPVDIEHIFFIHQRPDLISAGVSVGKGIYMGGNFKDAVSCINNRTITANDIKLFIGYCGWDDEELQAEINEGSWVVAETGEVIFKV